MISRIRSRWLSWPTYAHAFHAFVAGAFLALCFAPFHVVPLLFFSVPSLFALLHHAKTTKHAMLFGWAFGYGFFMAGTYWIAFSLLVDPDAHAWLLPFSILGLSALMALYFLPLGYLMHRMRSRALLQRMALFVLAWVALEWLRGQGMFGFPWNYTGYIIGFSDNFSQAAAYIGVYGLSALVLATAMLPKYIASLHARPVRNLAWGGAALALTGIYVAGGARIPHAITYTDTTLRIVQPNIPQALKWSAEGKILSFQRLRDLSTRHSGEAAPDMVIWPETAIAFVIQPDTNWQQLMDKFLPEGAGLISGVLRAKEGSEHLYNSVVSIHPNQPAIFYDKHQLVPFGEFIPLRDWLPFLPITQMGSDFGRGNGPQTLYPEHVPSFSPLVCYEAVFPGFSAARDDRPKWLLNITNDAWFGKSPGPYQHLEMVRFRAIEQGLPLVRVANTGISALIDPYGRVVAHLPLGAQGSLDMRLPAPLAEPFIARFLQSNSGT